MDNSVEESPRTSQNKKKRRRKKDRLAPELKAE